MLDEEITMRLRLINHTDFENVFMINNVEFGVGSTPLDTEVITAAGESIPFSLRIRADWPELVLQFNVSTDDIHTTIVDEGNWSHTEKDGVYLFSYTHSPDEIAFSFTVPTNPTIGIVIVGTTDPAIPPGSN